MLPPFVRAMYIWAIDALLNVFTTRSTQEFERFKQTPIPSVSRADQAPAIVGVEPLHPGIPITSSPADCEERFTELMRDGHFESAWDLLTPDSQESWEHRETFKREMEQRQPSRSLVGSRVREVRFLPTWTDWDTRKTYHQVAELVVDYRIRQRSREMVVTRDVHLVNVSGGWKSVCYKS
jgi:hypothetical protein